MKALGVTAGEIDIRPSCMQMFRDIGHPFARGEQVYDVTFENVQAGERTSHLFRLANLHNALVLGTGDLSELALGWMTYGVGDHMSHYNVNCSVPKTLIQYLIRWVISSRQFDAGDQRDPRRRSSTRRSRRSWCPHATGDSTRPAQKTAENGRALRAAGLQPLLHHPLRVPPEQGRLPGLARLGRQKPRRLAGLAAAGEAPRI